jgi:hypothetical protein
MKQSLTQAASEAVARRNHLHENTQPLIDAVLAPKAKVVERAVALTELLDYLGLAPWNPHPAPRRRS